MVILQKRESFILLCKIKEKQAHFTTNLFLYIIILWQNIFEEARVNHGKNNVRTKCVIFKVKKLS